jgi:hypothetical protein
MRILTTSAALSAALLLSLTSASPSFAKGHNNGFGAGAQGSLSGQVDDGQKNSQPTRESVGGPGMSGTSYGRADTLLEVEANKALGIHGNSDNAQTRGDGSGHPSERSGNE